MRLQQELLNRSQVTVNMENGLPKQLPEEANALSFSWGPSPFCTPAETPARVHTWLRQRGEPGLQPCKAQTQPGCSRHLFSPHPGTSVCMAAAPGTMQGLEKASCTHTHTASLSSNYQHARLLWGWEGLGASLGKQRPLRQGKRQATGRIMVVHCGNHPRTPHTAMTLGPGRCILL